MSVDFGPAVTKHTTSRPWVIKEVAVSSGPSSDSLDGRPRVTAVVVNHRTEELTRRCVESLRRLASTPAVLVVDNGSDETTVQRLHELADASTRLICNPTNRGHGPAMDQAIRAAVTEFVMTVDSDVEVLRPGLVEILLAPFEAPDLLAAGQSVGMNRYGYPASPTARLVIPYVYPATMMLRRALYLELPAFRHHGSPCLHTMRAAMKRGLRLAEVAVDDFVRHDGKGTCSHFGYGLGIMTSVDKILSRFRWFE